MWGICCNFLIWVLKGMKGDYIYIKFLCVYIGMEIFKVFEYLEYVCEGGFVDE